MDDGRKVLFGKYEVGKLLGKGTFAKVYHCRNVNTGESVAVKVINKAEVKKEKLSDQIKREINVMRLIRHPNVVELREVMATKTHIFVVMEYVRGGELFAKVARGRLKEDAARRYFQQLVTAVDYCHSRGVSHRDLKPENLLLDENGALKVSDFGLSALPEQLRSDGLLHTQCGTPAYVAPEVLRKKGYDGAKADIWSCGVILYVLLVGRLPFEEENVMRMYAKVFKAEFEFPPWVSAESRRIISKLLVVDPGRRMTMPAIMRCVWFNRGLCNTKGASQEVKKAAAEVVSPIPFNAFDLISSMSPAGLDLSSIFEERGKREGAAFTTRRGAAEVVARIGEAAAKGMRFEEEEEGGGAGLWRVRLNGVKEGRKGRLVVTAEVREVVPDMMTVVRFSKSAGDTLEYCRFCEDVVKPSLKDVVWAWQGE